MSDFLREVEEDVRRERYAQLWKSYGAIVVGIVAVVLTGAAGYAIWRETDRAATARASEAFYAAQLSGDPAAYAALAGEAPGGYAALAQMRAGAAFAERGDRAAAIAAFRAVPDMDGATAGLSEIATLKAAALMADSADPAEIETMLAPIVEGAGPARHLARETLGYAYRRSGDGPRARAQFRALVQDPASPAALRSRAELFLSILGPDPLEAPDPSSAPAPEPEPAPAPAPAPDAAP